MSIKKIILAMVVVLVVISAFPIHLSAAQNWYRVTINQIGPSYNGQVYVMLTAKNGAFTQTWFSCHPDLINRQMAVILTAMTNSLELDVLVDPALSHANLRTVWNMYMYSGQ